MSVQRELVRCGCGEVRTDEDPLAHPDFVGMYLCGAPYPLERGRFEAPRVCWRCGCVYMLPKPSAPTEKKDDAK